jgi:hypothetical protein
MAVQGLWFIIQVLTGEAASVVQEQVWRCTCKHGVHEGEGKCFEVFSWVRRKRRIGYRDKLQ